MVRLRNAEQGRKKEKKKKATGRETLDKIASLAEANNIHQPINGQTKQRLAPPAHLRKMMTRSQQQTPTNSTDSSSNNKLPADDPSRQTPGA